MIYSYRDRKAETYFIILRGLRVKLAEKRGKCANISIGRLRSMVFFQYLCNRSMVFVVVVVVASNLSSSGRSHVGALFANEEQKEVWLETSCSRMSHVPGVFITSQTW